MLKGLKINFLGDSITAGGCASKAENRYVDLIATKTGAVCRRLKPSTRVYGMSI